MIVRNRRIARLASRRASMYPRDRRPCFQFAIRLRSFPSSVRGPVYRRASGSGRLASR
jgi:hypothetical protein